MTRFETEAQVKSEMAYSFCFLHGKLVVTGEELF